MTPEQKRSNLRLGLILASVALAFFVGFVLKLTVFVPERRRQGGRDVRLPGVVDRRLRACARTTCAWSASSSSWRR